MSKIDFIIDENDIGKAKAISDQDIRRALEQCGALWETDAKKITPVDTGRLRNSQEGSETRRRAQKLRKNLQQSKISGKKKGVPHCCAAPPLICFIFALLTLLCCAHLQLFTSCPLLCRSGSSQRKGLLSRSQEALLRCPEYLRLPALLRG